MGVAIPGGGFSEDRASGALVVDGGLRFDGSKSQYLSRTIGAGSISWTYSGWVKRNRLSVEDSANDNTNYNGTLLANSGSTSLLAFYKNAGGAQNSIWLYDPNGTSKMTASKHRDVSSWYHIVANYNGSVANLYVNGIQINDFLGSDNTNGSGASGFSTNGATFYIGRISTAYSYFQLAQVYFIDGQALDPSYFGYTDPLTNVWRPKKLSSSIAFGTNGFYLPFDGSAPIGQDQSGRGNNWTPMNFGGSTSLEKATGALPILNTDGGGKVARVGVRTDANASSLVLALPLVGIKSDFSNRINSGTSNKAVTINGDAAASSAQSNFYGGSFVFDGTGDYLSLSASADFGFSTPSGNANDFTIEWFKYWNSLSGYQTIWSNNYVSSPGLLIQTGNGDGKYRVFVSAGTELFQETNAAVVGVWYHYALVRNGTTYTIYRNGVANGSATSSNAAGSGSDVATIGQGNGSYYENGYIQDFRIYKGLAKYTSNFIPASTDPDVVPDSPSGVSYSSNVALVPSTDGAVAFDGSGDYLRSTGLEATGTSDYTIECFVYLDYISGTRQYIWDTRNSSGSNGTYLIKNESNTWYWTPDNTTSNDNNLSLDTIPTNRWTHIAFVRESGTAKLYVDGNLKATLTSHSGNLTSTQATIFAAWDNNVPGKGFISNFHIVKGTALYTSNFTPPSGPISSVANTKLLCCKSQTSATAADVTPGTITANGNATATNFNPFTVNINTQRGKQSGYCTWNPLKTKNFTLSEGNLRALASNTTTNSVVGTIGASSGKWYWEVVMVGGSDPLIGICNDAISLDNYPGGDANGWGYYSNGNKYTNSTAASYGASYTTSDVIGVALNMDAGTVAFYKNGISQGQAYSGLTGTIFPAVGDGGNSVAPDLVANFGQKPFKFPPPAGFQPLTLANTPRPTIVRPDQYVGVTTWSGAQSGSGGLTRQINTTFQPDFVWIKQRNQAYSTGHQLYDSVRGAGAEKELNSSGTGAEGAGNIETYGWLNSFDKTGFTVKGGSADYDYVDKTGVNYVAWAWKAGGNSNTFNINDVGYATASAAGLTAGTITPTGASVNTKSGFSIIKYNSGGSTGNYTISHGLTQTPKFIIHKSLGTSNWWVYHASAIDNLAKYLQLNSTNGVATNSANMWGGQFPDSSVLGVRVGDLIGTSTDAIMYAWAEIPGFSKFGSYTGNTIAGNFVYLGFRPKLLLIKNYSGGTISNWAFVDSTRSYANVANHTLAANLANAESSFGGGESVFGASNKIDLVSNGFVLREGNAWGNESASYIYAAFAEAPSFNLYGAQSNAR